MKRILWINEKADFTGGCESYIFHTADAMQQQGFHNILLYDVSGWTEPSFVKGFDESYPLVSLSRQLKEIEPDIIYVHRLSGKKSLLQLLHSKIPVVRFFHDHKLFCLREHKYRTIGLSTCRKASGLRCYPCLGFIKRSSNWTKISFSSLPKLLEEQSLNRKFNGFVVASEYMKQHLILHRFENNKIKVLPLYSWKGKEKPGAFGKGKYFLYAGQLLRGKGLDLALRSLTLLPPEIKLYIAGKGKQEEMFKNLSVKLGINERVQFLGFLEKEKMESLYKNCLALIMPSRVPETFGLSGLEAMSYGKPVIASDVGGISQWLIDDLNGILLPENKPEFLAKAMNRLFSDPKLAAEMGKRGFEEFVQKYQPSNHIEKLIEYFDEIVSGG